MALMWPRELPEHIKADPRRASEIRVYEKLSKVLGDDWSVYYSRPWWGINSKGGEIDGEADFILAHGEKGILFLEVKGGGISFAPDTGRWQTKDRNGITHNIKDPVLQAITCKHQFLSKLKKFENWPLGYIRFRHGVILPDSKSLTSQSFTLGGYDMELFCFADEFDSNLNNWIEARVKSHNKEIRSGEIGPGEEGLRCLNILVAEPVQLKVPLRREIENDITQMDQLLTGMQLGLISIILSKNRVLVEGGAGTGKTILAIESAIRESQEGKKILFCCKSAPLAKLVKERLKKFPGVDVRNIEALQALINSNTSITKLISETGWNAIYIDEAQDIDWEIWDLFEEISQSHNIFLKIFFDSNQSVYRLHDDLATRLRAISIPLSTNLRNTKKIARVTEGLYSGPLIHCHGPEGINPITFECSFLEAIDQASNQIHTLITQESIAPQMIAILVPNSAVREDVLGILMRKRIPACDSISGTGHEVIVESVARFKGLESEIVILLADRMLAKNQELSYVAVSRARSRLYVYGVISNTTLGNSLLGLSSF